MKKTPRDPIAGSADPPSAPTVGGYSVSAQAPDVDRRTWLKQVGVATGAMLLPGLAGCADDAVSAGGDVGSDAPTDAESDGETSPTPDTDTDAAADAEVGTDTTDVAGPFPSLQPVRGDGSHPYHYIDTVVIVQMENRSFDHYFGALSLLEGRTDVDGLRAEMTNPDRDGVAVPILHLADDYVISPDPGHGHGPSLTQFNEGANDGFVRDWENRVSQADRAEKLGWPLGYYRRDQLPAYYPLADNYTLCDRWFCSLLGPTWPNRFYSHAATSDGAWGNDRPLNAVTPYRYALDQGLSVGVYHQSIIYAMLTVFNPRPNQYPNGYMEEFFADAEAGRLPNITIVEPDYTFNDDHPPQDIRFGQGFVAGIYEALRQSPQWDRCLMLVFYDEHGGFHDHVPPPKAEGESRADEGFDQLGFRVPGLVIGPLAKRGHVFHDVLEHSSVPSLLSKIFELEHVNERSRLAPDFAGALDLELTLNSARPIPPQLPEIDLDFEKIRRAFDEPFGQPEMEDFARRVWGIERESKARELARAESLLRVLESLRVARVR